MMFFNKLVWLGICVRFVYMEKYYKYFEFIEGKTIKDLQPQRKAIGITQCIGHCLKEKACVAVVHNITDLNCFLLNSTTSPEDTTDSGTTYVQVGGGCMDGWLEFGGSCYLISLEEYPFVDSEEMCKEYGARLIEVDSEEENEYIRNILSSYMHKAFWIGIIAPTTNSNWQLASTGDDASYIAWDSSQPNQVREPNCAVFWQECDYRWGDESCYFNYHPICEQNATYNI